MVTVFAYELFRLNVSISVAYESVRKPGIERGPRRSSILFTDQCAVSDRENCCERDPAAERVDGKTQPLPRAVMRLSLPCRSPPSAHDACKLLA
jgi:hypothetical protein